MAKSNLKYYTNPLLLYTKTQNIQCQSYIDLRNRVDFTVFNKEHDI